MNYRQLVIDENERKLQTEREEYRNKDGWKWLNLNDKEGIRIFAECMKLDKIEEENEKLANAEEEESLDDEWNKFIDDSSFQEKKRF